MARANPAVRKLLAAVVAPLVKAHGGATKVASVVDRDRTTVHRWTEGNIDWDGLAALASGTRRDIVITFPAHGRPKAKAKEPPPEWAGELLREIQMNRAVIQAMFAAGDPALVQRILDRFAAPGQLPTSSGGEAPDPIDAAT